MRRWVILLAAGLMLAGCGTAAAEGGHPALAAGKPNGPGSGTKTEAIALARDLLARPVLPQGWGRAPNGLRIPPALDFASVVTGAETVGRHVFMVAPGKPQAVQRYVKTHAPRGTLVGSGQGGGPAGTMTWIVFLDFASSRPGIYQARADYTMVSLTSTSTLVRIDVTVIWYPPRSAAEHIDTAATRAVTVTAVMLNLDSSGSRRVSRTFTSRGIIGKLAGLLNSYPAAPEVAVACPGNLITYTVRLTGAERIDITSDGCLGDAVSVNGRTQPFLLDMKGQFAALAGRLLGIKE